MAGGSSLGAMSIYVSVKINKENLVSLLRHIIKSAACRIDDLSSYFSSVHFVVDGSACVSSCPLGKTEKEKNGIKQCETCIGLCPKGKVSIQTFECFELYVLKSLK